MKATCNRDYVALRQNQTSGVKEIACIKKLASLKIGGITMMEAYLQWFEMVRQFAEASYLTLQLYSLAPNCQ